MQHYGRGWQRPADGFTLIELMIVLVIVGILATIAYPSYIKYVRDAQRSDAQAGLMDTAQKLEQCYTRKNSYDECSASAEHLTQRGYWKIKPGIPRDGQTYTLTAIKTGNGVIDEACSKKMVIDQTGKRAPKACW